MRHEVHRSSTLEYLAVYPEDYQNGAVYPLLIWLHGFGADMYDLAAAVHRTGYLHLLPNAPVGGFGAPEGTVRAWFERGGNERPDSVLLALAALDAFVQEVLARFRVPARQALLVGFSQGGNLALRYGLPRPEVCAGLVALSCSLRSADDLRESLPGRRDQPIFIAHGVDDLLVPVEWGRQVAESLKEQGYPLVCQEYPMGHEIGPALFTGLVQWITKSLPPRPVRGFPERGGQV
jgi:phospholipase/carboxylesterase